MKMLTMSRYALLTLISNDLFVSAKSSDNSLSSPVKGFQFSVIYHFEFIKLQCWWCCILPLCWGNCQLRGASLCLRYGESTGTPRRQRVPHGTVEGNSCRSVIKKKNKKQMIFSTILLFLKSKSFLFAFYMTIAKLSYCVMF